MADETKEHAFRREAPSWAISAALHVGALIVLSMIPYLAIRLARRSPDAPILLTPPAGADLHGTDDPGGARGGNAARDRAFRPDDALAKTPKAAAPPPKAMETLLAQLPVPELRADALVGSADPTGKLLADLAAVSRTADFDGGGGLGALLMGTSKGFGDHIGNLRGQGLDVLLVLDATDSMSPYIYQAKVRLHEILNVITGLVPNARFGVVAYKDYGDDYGPNAVRVKRLTEDTRGIRACIDGIVAGGGADEPEPINEALLVATNYRKAGWKTGRKWVIILVGDSTIHASGQKKAFELAGNFARRKGTINVIDVGGTGAQGQPRQIIQPDLKRIAELGGGSAFLLTDEKLFWRYLIVSVFGKRFEQDVDVIIRKFAKEK